jgi:hypothetical protein
MSRLDNGLKLGDLSEHGAPPPLTPTVSPQEMEENPTSTSELARA